jgi:hypothetical protein
MQVLIAIRTAQRLRTREAALPHLAKESYTGMSLRRGKTSTVLRRVPRKNQQETARLVGITDIQ